MSEALYEDFLRLQKGDELRLYNQELNPPDRSEVLILEILWRHDRVEDDLIYGSMEIEGLGFLDVDAFIFRTMTYENRPDISERAWLSSVDTKQALDAPFHMTGGVLRTTPPLPSEMHASADRRDPLSGKFKPELQFTRDEHSAIMRWQLGIRQKGFRSDFPEEDYAKYRTVWIHGLSSSITKDGLRAGLSISAHRKGLFGRYYSVSLSDSSFRDSSSNPSITHARPRLTWVLREKCSSLEESLNLMDKCVDLIVTRNARHL